MGYIFDRNEIRDIANIFASCDKFSGKFENGDTVLLWLLNSYLPSLGSNTIHQTLVRRFELAERIAKCRRPDGLMYVTEGGMDCDGVQYSGTIHECEATLRGYEKLQYDINSWADGPFSTCPITVEEAKKTTYSSRDLAMEAFEDGHSHILSTVPFDEDGPY
ncbi:hypothetical protein KAR91_10925 [Candidatus Pacearchaeota archaeon]|nr:hypothetical protein [Candidatus Pacearchaeota archaeon]